jgi:phosphoribosylanthranilate isomerase
LHAAGACHTIGLVARTRIKICGITRAEDARLAALAGADAIGMVCHAGSRRGVSLERAGQIVAAAGAFVTPVALFVDAPVEQVLQTARQLGVGTVQLHGQETPEQVAALRGLRVIKAVRVRGGQLAGDLDEWRRAIGQLKLDHLVGLVLETDTPAAGGSGMANDWQAIARCKQAGAFEGLPAMIAAGGLRPENVAGVVRLLGPWAVDVSSGVESVFGQKSEALVRQFVEAVRGADA